VPQAVFADLRNQREGSPVIDHFELILYYPQIKVSLKAGMLVRADLPKYLLFGRNGTFIKHGTDPQEADLLAGHRPHSYPNWGKEQQNTWGTINTNINTSHIIGNIESQIGNYGVRYS